MYARNGQVVGEVVGRRGETVKSDVKREKGRKQEDV